MARFSVFAAISSWLALSAAACGDDGVTGDGTDSDDGTTHAADDELALVQMLPSRPPYGNAARSSLAQLQTTHVSTRFSTRFSTR